MDPVASIWRAAHVTLNHVSFDRLPCRAAGGAQMSELDQRVKERRSLRGNTIREQLQQGFQMT